MADTPSATPVAHGFYPALTHFTDAITALPREFRRHNSLLKEVDAKAWALEDNLLQLLKSASESQPVPYPSTPVGSSLLGALVVGHTVVCGDKLSTIVVVVPVLTSYRD